MKVKLVRITFLNGTTVTGVVPATITDHELNSMQAGGVDVIFSDDFAVAPETALAKVLAKGAAAVAETVN